MFGNRVMRKISGLKREEIPENYIMRSLVISVLEQILLG
jgi:hypothetical protein